jgi:hypothetical protein
LEFQSRVRTAIARARVISQLDHDRANAISHQLAHFVMRAADRLRQAKYLLAVRLDGATIELPHIL